MSEIVLPGCRADRLAGWLSAVGVLRVVAEQVDPNARLRWALGEAIVASRLDRDELRSFLLEDYRPAPVCSPWNGGSGFFAGDRSARSAHDRLLAEESPRFDDLRSAITVCREVIADRSLREKPTDAAKPALIAALRARLSDQAVRWLDAVAILTDDRPAFPPLLGSGGNDGRWELSSNYARALISAIGLEAPKRGEGPPGSMLDAALFGISSPLGRANLGPLARDDSPTRSPQLRDSEEVGNPWDLVLAVEGCLLLAAAAARRLAAAGPSLASAPFTVRTTSAGYGSAVAGEGGRAEVWLPTWPRPARLVEVEALLREGRAQLGAASARTGLDMARSAGSLGVARGLDGFERQILLARAGRDHLAIHAGRVEVAVRPEAAMLADIDDWRSRLVAWTDAPAGVGNAVRALERTTFDLAARGGSTAAAEFVTALGGVQAALTRSGRAAAERGLRPLRVEEGGRWQRALGDTREVRLAVCIASLRDSEPRRSVPSLRDYLLGTGVDSNRRPTYHPANPPPVDRDASPVRVLARTHERRWLDAGCGFLGGAWAGPADLVAVATRAETLDLDRVLALARGLCALTWSRPSSLGEAQDRRAAPPAPVFELLSLAWRGAKDRRLEARPDWAARLRAGAVRLVVREAMLRLEFGGLQPVARPEDVLVVAPRALNGEALAAALLPIPSPQALAVWADRHCEPVRVLAPSRDGEREAEPYDNQLHEPEVPTRV